MVVLNKMDLVQTRPAARAPASLPFVAVSALTGAGMDELLNAITHLADLFQRDIGEDIVAINARHADAFGRAQVCLRGARAKLGDKMAIELLASDLRGALDAFGAISGRIDNERMLDQLFATFCIGK